MGDIAEEEELVCPLCSELYEEENHEPVMLPRCGHVFCRPCLLLGQKKGHFPCPTCRKRHLKPPVPQLPVHMDVLVLAVTFRETTLGTCDQHGQLMEYWCRQCQMPLCGACKVKKGHEIARSKLVLDEKKQEIKEKGTLILQNVKEEKQKIMTKVKDCSLQLLMTCEDSSLTTTSADDVQVMMNEAKKCADLKSVLSNLKRMKNILGNFGAGKASSPEEEEEGKDSEKRSEPTRRRRARSTHRTQCNKNSSSEIENHIDEKENKPENNNSGMQSREPVETAIDRIGYGSRLRPNGTMNGFKADPAYTGAVVGLLDTSMWPLKCCVYADDGRRARLNWENGRLHLYSLGTDVDDAHFMIKMSVLHSLIPHDNPEVFLDLEAGDVMLGRVYIRLWGYLRRAHHFLALCMGTYGPSYRGSRFDEVFARGLKGECLHGGEYLLPHGKTSSKGVMKDLEWDGKFKAIQRQGLVVGAGSGRPDRDSRFDICTIENPMRSFACAFGEVVAGWEAVQATIKHRPVRQVKMKDVGVVIPDFAKPF